MTKLVLHIAPTPFFSDRGCHIRIEGIVGCLSNLGYDNLVCTYHHGREISGVKTCRITPIKNYTQTAAGPSKYKLWADWKLLWVGFKQYKNLKPVTLHAHLHEGLMIALILKTLFFWRRTPVIADMQGSLTGELESHGVFKKWPLLKWPTHTIERFLMLCADHILCSSSHSLSKIQSEFSIRDDKISLAQDGAHAAPTLSKESAVKLKQQLALPSDKVIVVYSGALLAAKGLNELEQVILKAQVHSNDLHFLIIGYPTQDLQAFLEEHQLDDLCTLTGQVKFEQLAGHLSLADIAIDPKNSDAGEGSGKMLNYLASRLPVVAFNTANNRDFLPTNTVLAADSNALTEQLLLLTHNLELRDKIAHANLEQFENHYSWQVTQQQLSAIYHQP